MNLSEGLAKIYLQGEILFHNRSSILLDNSLTTKTIFPQEANPADKNPEGNIVPSPEVHLTPFSFLSITNLRSQPGKVS